MSFLKEIRKYNFLKGESDGRESVEGSPEQETLPPEI